MDSVRSLCNTGIILKNGLIDFNGDINHAISRYMEISKNETMFKSISNLQLNPLVSVELFEIDRTVITTHDDLNFNLKIKSAEINHTTSVAIFIFNQLEQKVAFFDLRSNALTARSDVSDTIEISGSFKSLPLLPGIYKLGIHIQSNLLYKDFPDLIQFEVLQKKLVNDNIAYPIQVRGMCDVDYAFDVK
jgi:lipopolysaccharide transport system ATP-binding protein